MEATTKKIDFGQPQWLEKVKCNNNNVFEDQGKFCDENGEAKRGKCQCQRIQHQQLPVIKLPPADDTVIDEAGGLQLPLTEATNGGNFNDDEDEMLSTALATHSPPNSNRTSINNSTDNLSYNSENYYVDELIVLQNTLSDEEVSLNSDDCIYAYRGGAEFDITLETRNNNIEDETDFLEMDFEPDPLSEVDPSIDLRSLQYSQPIFLSNSIDDCTAGIVGGIELPERQMFSSPIENGKATLCHRYSTNNDFANVSLNLTQIQSASTDADEDRISPVTVSCTIDDTRSKITGAKPKRIAERNISMTKNRKTTFHSKLNKASGATASLCSVGSLDERGSSTAFPPLHNVGVYAQKDLSDETCLDCLEKEFLANTIGKPIEWSECPKCKNKIGLGHCNSSGSSRSSSSNASLCISNSSSVLCCKPPLSLSFDLNDLLPVSHGRELPYVRMEVLNKDDSGSDIGSSSSIREASHGKGTNAHKNYQRLSSCDNIDANKCSDRIEKLVSTFLSLNVEESTLVQALDKIKVSYNKELISSYFQGSPPEFKSLKQFILHQSKKNCNYLNLKKLIELACNGTVIVEYHPDDQILHAETVQISSADILHQWTKTNKLVLLKQLDKRFMESNILGKIIHIIRQAQQRNNAKSTTEFISIPQYYKSGYITVATKK